MALPSLYRKTMEIVCPNTIIWNNCLYMKGGRYGFSMFFRKLHVFTFAHVEQLAWRNHPKKEHLGLLHNSKRCDLVITQLSLSKVDDFIILPPFNSFLWIFLLHKKRTPRTDLLDSDSGPSYTSHGRLSPHAPGVLNDKNAIGMHQTCPERNRGGKLGRSCNSRWLYGMCILYFMIHYSHKNLI